MPKWRKLWCKSVDSPDINDMPSDFHRLLWLLLPTQLDRCGRGYDSAVWVRSKVFPLREDVTVDMVEDALDWYASQNMIERYEAEGREYFWIPSWHKHQGSTSREAKSDFPAPPDYVDPTKAKENGSSESGEDQEDTHEENKTRSRPTHEPVMSDSSTDIEVDVDVDVEGEVEEDALATLFEHFTAVTSIDPPMIRGPGTPSQERYDDEWVLPLQDILTQAKGDLDLAKKAIEIAVERQDEDGYNVSCPQSIRKNSIGALRTYHDNEGTFDEGGLAAW